jgi:hypothetical protein
MKFKYVGPHDAVDLAGVGNDIKRGDEVEVPPAVAKSLDAQADWRRVATKTPAKSATKNTEE